MSKVPKRKRKQARTPLATATKGPAASPAKPAAQGANGGPRAGSKLEMLLALLKRPEGASIEALAKATGWQAHSVRGAIAGTIKKKLGHDVKSERRDNGERIYSLG